VGSEEAGADRLDLRRLGIPPALTRRTAEGGDPRTLGSPPSGMCVQDVLPKSTALVSTVPAVRPGAVWYFQYRFVCAMTCSGGGAPQAAWSSVVWASLTGGAASPLAN